MYNHIDFILVVIMKFQKNTYKKFINLIFPIQVITESFLHVFFYKKPLEAENSIQETEGLHSLPPKKLFY